MVRRRVEEGTPEQAVLHGTARARPTGHECSTLVRAGRDAAAVFLAAFDFNVVTIAIPSIQRGLGTSFGEIQLIVAGYALSFAVLLITGGRLGEADRKSTRLNSSHRCI